MIYVLNQSTLITEAEARSMVRAVNTQVSAHLAPAWGMRPVGVHYARTAPAGARTLTLLDTLDQADALGWHTDDSQGIYGVIGVKPVLDNGGRPLDGPLSVASVLSHEVCELLCDPYCTSWSDTGRGYLVATEVCDPVQTSGYPIHGVTVSNFVTPAWFDQTPAGGPYDHLGVLQAPFSLDRGGYWVQMRGGQVTQKFGTEFPTWLAAAKALRGSRTHYRTAGGIR